ncbi:MAG TPA: type IV toxin-antitoxin system AbiEi family antitoxin domain-containing protein [Actinomycetota bacterium]
MPGRVYMELLEAATSQYGHVTADDARGAGVDPAQLRIMHHRGLLERVARGVYRFPILPATALDQYMEAVLWPRTKAALSHETALDLHGLCDVNPARIHVTVPAGYRLRRDAPRIYQLHRRGLDAGDVTLHEGIPIVTPYRAIRDAIEANLGGHLIDQAISTAQRRGLIAPAELRLLKRARPGRRPGPRPRPETIAAHR